MSTSLLDKFFFYFPVWPWFTFSFFDLKNPKNFAENKNGTLTKILSLLVGPTSNLAPPTKGYFTFAVSFPFLILAFALTIIVSQLDTVTAVKFFHIHFFSFPLVNVFSDIISLLFTNIFPDQIEYILLPFLTSFSKAMT